MDVQSTEKQFWFVAENGDGKILTHKKSRDPQIRQLQPEVVYVFSQIELAEEFCQFHPKCRPSKAFGGSDVYDKLWAMHRENNNCELFCVDEQAGSTIQNELSIVENAEHYFITEGRLN